jgi:hypothetical protein
MNENQIIQALEICKQNVACEGCPYYRNFETCFSRLSADVLSLIERQREEINELTGKHYNECGQIAKYSDELYKVSNCLDDIYNIVIEKAEKQTAGGESNE